MKGYKLRPGHLFNGLLLVLFGVMFYFIATTEEPFEQFETTATLFWSYSNLFLVFYLFMDYNLIRQRIRLHAENQLWGRAIYNIRSLFRSRENGVFSGLLLAMGIAMVFTQPVSHVLVFVAFGWIQMFMTLYVALLLNNETGMNILRNLVFFLFVLRIVLENWAGINVFLNPFALITTFPAFVFSFQPLVYIVTAFAGASLACILFTFLIIKAREWKFIQAF